MIDDGLLIDLVRQHECLYNKGYKDYKNKIVKENAWKTIASLVSDDENLNPTVVEQRWLVLRNRFCTELRAVKGIPSGAGATPPLWPFFQTMKFLLKFIKTRQTKGSYSGISSPAEVSSPLSSPTLSTSSQDPWNTMSTIISEEDVQDMPEVESEMEVTLEDCEGTGRPLRIENSKSNIETPSTSRDSADASTEKRKISQLRQTMTGPKPKKKKDTDKDALLLDGLTDALGTVKNYLQEKNTADQDVHFGMVVAEALKKIKNKKEKYKLMAKIMQDISEFESDSEDT